MADSITAAATRKKQTGHQFSLTYNEQMAAADLPSLYKRMGGYDVIAAVVDDLLGMLRADPRFARFGMGRSIDSHQRARQLLLDQLCQLAGGPCFYTGRDMKTSHAGLGITDQEWQINLDYTRKALSNHGVSERDQTEFVALFERYRRDIVEGTGSSA